MFHMSVSDNLLLLAFMSNFGPAPLAMTRKISPSVSPRSHLASVRSDGCVSFGAIGPLPFASAPWQKRQFFWKSALPASTDSLLDAIGFFIFLPSGLPPGFCADSVTKVASRSPGNRTVRRRRMINPLAMDLITETLLGDDDRDLVVAEQRAIVGAAAEHVRARLAEC